MTWRKLIRLLESNGWQLVSQRGSHRKYRHPDHAGHVTAAPHRMTSEVPRGTESAILKAAGLKK